MKVDDERFLRGLYDLKYLFGDKWAPAILVTLADGPMRRKEILSTISSYSIGEEWSDKHAVLHDSILARTLKKMTEGGLLTRTRCTETFPVQVVYSLKPEVLEFLSLSEVLVGWADGHPELVAQAQAYSRRNGDETVTLTGIAELDELDIADDEDDE
ncbi:winged helix-turn-helix transcriptional regulator [Amycolatopsis sp. H20-H5]|uniref:winged helix-turn-helix transcriptional regulator n=1 Tax=Amycolatopsis sp. H20-H5 TaxID=3046309 RepID=UPI002DBA9620|nr:winged helix-turn-helix transcriptional regulator [Amycolatopsis sp. H20-H5]MEC3974937.1 winged helix-turn-helix transcriptional regulator [Amycolatopsis sp. H20-H5]